MTDYTGAHWATAALILIDVQNDFLDEGASPIPGTSEVLPNLALLRDAFRSAGRPIAHVVRLYETGGSDVDLPRRDAIERGQQLVAPGSWGSQVPDALRSEAWELQSPSLLNGAVQPIGPAEVVLYKPRWSAFHRTELDAWLTEQGIDTVVVAGCNLPNCPRATLFDASERDYRTVLVTDAVSQSSPERLDDLARIGVSLLAADAVIASLAGDRRP